MKDKLLNYFSFENIFKFLIIILPFNVILTVFLDYKLWIRWIWIYKEILLLTLWAYLAVVYFKNKKIPKFDFIDYSIIWYITYLIFISVIDHTWIKAIIYGWRYDFEFLLIFLFVRHWRFLLSQKISYYIRIFLISSSIAILIWILVRFVFWESILLYFGFSPHISVYSVLEWIPIYHSVPWANVRRFQWIFDWPNQAAFFLIFYSSLLFHYLKSRKEDLFYLYTILFVIWWLIFLTYCRSAILWIIGWLWMLLLLNLKIIFKKYRVQSFVIVLVIAVLWWLFYVKYWWSINEIIIRPGSSKWHYERMIYGFKQFLDKPQGRWLASSGPWYRATYGLKAEDEQFVIPESWYVQQLVEWWIIGFFFFISIMFLILVRIYPLSKPLFFSFFAILLMNVVLHTFEASYISILMFIFLGLFLSKKEV